MASAAYHTAARKHLRQEELRHKQLFALVITIWLPLVIWDVAIHWSALNAHIQLSLLLIFIPAGLAAGAGALVLTSRQQTDSLRRRRQLILLAFPGLVCNGPTLGDPTDRLTVVIGQFCFSLDIDSGRVTSELTRRNYEDGEAAYLAAVRYTGLPESALS